MKRSSDVAECLHVFILVYVCVSCGDASRQKEKINICMVWGSFILRESVIRVICEEEFGFEAKCEDELRVHVNRETPRCDVSVDVFADFESHFVVTWGGATRSPA